MSYFSRNKDSVEPMSSEDEDAGLRNCQKGAYWALQSHFTAHDERTPAIISLPTGAGKTALMMLIPFMRESQRVLVVGSSSMIRDQTTRRFRELTDLRKAGILTGGLAEDEDEGPSVNKITDQMSEEDWGSEIHGYDVVVALPDNISPKFAGKGSEIALPPTEDFDLVFIDEAHHASSEGWGVVVDHFSETERILLTATAFRRDRKSLPGKVAYHYPVDRAIEDGIYQQMEYRPVTETDNSSDYNPVCKRAANVLKDLQSTDQKENAENSKQDDIQPAILARTDKKERANKLVKQYDEVGLDLRAVHSGKNPRQNSKSIEALKQGNIDGVVGIDALAEGFDVEHLQIAVLHNIPKSFPFTYQLLGRVARPSPVSDNSIFIADSRMSEDGEVEEAVRRLYIENAAWGSLIPELVDEFVDRQERRSQYESSDFLAGFDETELGPYRSLRIYIGSGLERWETVDPEIDMRMVRLDITENEDGFIGFVTERIKEPPWGKQTLLEYSEYDLHLYYQPSGSNTLFEFTTNQGISKKIRDEICPSAKERISGQKLARVLQENKSIRYHVAGLANSSLPSGKLPTYKMFLGDDVQGAIDPSDARNYTRGHALARLNEDTTRGISGGNGRLWEQGRISVDGFSEWCEELYTRLADDNKNDYPPGFEFLNNMHPSDSFDGEPILVVPNPMLIPEQLSYVTDSGDLNEIESIEMGVREFNESSSSEVEVAIDLNLDSRSKDLGATYNVECNTWSGEIEDAAFRYDGSNEPGEIFLQEFPPYIYTGKGKVYIGGEVREVEIKYESFDIEDSGDIDWSDCDISREEPDGLEKNDFNPDELWSHEKSNESVHQKLVSHLRSHFQEQVLFYDHKRGEIADIIQILPNESESKKIRFYHCKSAKDDDAEPGASLGRIADVHQQVLRNTNFIDNSRLPDRIEHREGDGEEDSDDSLQHFIEGKNIFEEISSDFIQGEWEYEVVIVHPGLDPDLNPDESVKGGRTQSNVNVLLCVCYEWLQDAGADLEIWGGT